MIRYIILLLISTLRLLERYYRISALLLTIAISLSACTYPRQSLNRYEFSHRQMGTQFQLILYAPTQSLANRAADSAFAHIDALNALLSDYLPDSELNRLSATAGSGQAVSVSEPLWRVLVSAQEIAELTAGAFDVSVGPYIQLWRRARRQGELPSAEAIGQAKQVVGYHNIHLNKQDSSVLLLKPNMKLDVGGIGKGFAADEVLRVLQAFEVTSALIDAGGDITLGDAPPGKPGWQVEIGIPGRAGNQTLTLSRRAIATSGDYYQYVEIDGKRYSHIVNPFTGKGLTTQTMVTVIAPDGTTADALASAVSVLGPEKTKWLFQKLPHISARISYENGAIWESEGFGR